MSVAGLRARLDEMGLAALLAIHYDASSGRLDALRSQREAVGGRLGDALGLLCLGEWVEEPAASAAIGGPALERLVAVGVADHGEQGVRLRGARLVEHYGALVFVGAPGATERGYYGPDSIGLGRLLLDPRGRCLDLFAATGAQSVLMARGGGEVTAVELDAELAPMLELNLELNACDGAVAAVWSDVREWVPAGEYDTVAVNAPLLPTFGLEGLHFGADGGASGHELLEAALARVRLAPGGRIRATATVPGGEQGPDVAWLRALGERAGVSWVVVPTGMGVLSPESRFAQGLADTLASASGVEVGDVIDRFERTREAAGADRVFFCLLAGARTDATAGVDVAAPPPERVRWWR